MTPEVLRQAVEVVLLGAVAVMCWRRQPTRRRTRRTTWATVGAAGAGLAGAVAAVYLVALAQVEYADSAGALSWLTAHRLDQVLSWLHLVGLGLLAGAVLLDRPRRR